MRKLITIAILVVLMLSMAVPMVSAGAPQNCIGDQLSDAAQAGYISDAIRVWVELEPGAWGERVSSYHAQYCQVSANSHTLADREVDGIPVRGG